MNWQPIETAPANKNVLLAFQHHPVALGSRMFGRWIYSPCVTEGGDSPTHWMPLPAPPAPEPQP